MPSVRIKIIVYMLITCLLCGCARNYLNPVTMQSTIEVDHHTIKPHLIPINAELLNTASGRMLLKAALEPKPYRVGVYDKLNVIVWGHPELSTVVTAPALNAAQTFPGGSTNPTLLVDADGATFFPYVGHVKVAGLTVTEIEGMFTQYLAKYLRHPQVTVQVATFRNRNVYILGEVNGPGMQSLTDRPLSVLDAISRAGGINPASSDPTHIYVIRGHYLQPDIFILNATTPQTLMMASNFPLQEKDIVYVSTAALTGFNRFMGQILPALLSYAAVKSILQ